VAVFNPEGTGAALSTVITLAVLRLVFPTFTTSTPGPEPSNGQLALATIASLGLYALFVFVHSVRHRDHFLPVRERPMPWRRRPEAVGRPEDVEHAARPTTRVTHDQPGALARGPRRRRRPAQGRVPHDRVDGAVGGPAPGLRRVVIALLVLLPETLAAVRNARRDRVQISLNLGLGSAMASIGLTIPTSRWRRSGSRAPSSWASGPPSS
jgi:Ca2+:H+ antiporter